MSASATLAMRAAQAKTVLPSGMTVLTERMEHLRSATAGIWLKKGSRHEAPADNGISHFIEHLVFKGTETRSCREIARAIDRIGGMTDASTSKEFATFSVKVMDEHLPQALDLLCDILTHPAFDPDELENERKVIFEEIKSSQDNPEDFIGELYYEKYFAGHPLGRSILGTADSVKAISRERAVDFFRESYVPWNLTVSAAGKVEHDALVELFADRFPARPRPAGREPEAGTAPVVHPGRTYARKKELEQAHIHIGFPGLHRAHDERFALYVLNNILGGGMSSRLFQNIREKHGLAYSILSYLSSFRDAGTLAVYTAVDPKETVRTIRLIMDELAAICRDPVDARELDDTKDHIKGSLMLGLESSSSRMAALAVNDMYFGRQISPDEILEAVSAVTADDLLRLSRRLFRTDEISLVVLGTKPQMDLAKLDMTIS